jgi:hypothetical protein
VGNSLSDIHMYPTQSLFGCPRPLSFSAAHTLAHILHTHAIDPSARAAQKRGLSSSAAEFDNPFFVHLYLFKNQDEERVWSQSVLAAASPSSVRAVMPFVDIMNESEIHLVMTSGGLFCGCHWLIL